MPSTQRNIPWFRRVYSVRSSGGSTEKKQTVIGLPPEIGRLRIGRQYTWKVRHDGVLELHPVEESGE